MCIRYTKRCYFLGCLCISYRVSEVTLNAPQAELLSRETLLA